MVPSCFLPVRAVQPAYYFEKGWASISLDRFPCEQNGGVNVETGKSPVLGRITKFHVEYVLIQLIMSSLDSTYESQFIFVSVISPLFEFFLSTANGKMVV